MLIILYGVCGTLLGFIVGYEFAWEKRSLMQHGKQINVKAFIRRLIIG